MTEPSPARRRSFARSRTGRWHRAVGAVGGLVFVFMALTGVAIHHSVGLGLDQKLVRAPWLLSIWGIESSFVGIETTAGRVAFDGRAIFPPVGESLAADELIAAIEISDILAVASPDRIWLIDETGQLLDEWSDGMVSGSIRRIGTSDSRLIVETTAGIYAADRDLMDLAPVPTPASPQWSSAASPLPQSVRSDLARLGAGPGLSIERILLDLHSGRVAGRIGPYLMDVAALALSLVVFTGLIGWWSRWGNGKGDPKNADRRESIGRMNRVDGSLNPPGGSRNSDRRSA